MKIFRGFEQARGIRNPVVTTGSFDGVHIGHKTILNRLKLLAEKHNGESVLITFDPHPRKVLYPETAGKSLKLINSQEEKLELLRKAGLDNLIIVEFTREFSKTTSEEFVRNYLHGILKAKVVVAGFNHHFGFNQEGDYRQLWGWREKYNFEAEEIPEQEVQHETVSSTNIRKAISEGYIQRANAYLDHYYMIMGIPEKHAVIFDLPFLKIPLTEECKLLPATGIYAVSVISGQANTKGMVVINESHEKKPEILLHIFEEADMFQGKTSTILFHKMIHGSVYLSEAKTAERIINAKSEITDLIY
ncbi:MAG: adenylyltransferase/cytidyltransferase family protein [Bacteroidales bacterium]|nr:adenylyltransferase/cytidyltransferase family protein [Bacteroidales bacterium]